MKTFKDRMGREWPVSVDTNALKRVKSLLGVDLLDLLEGEKLLQKFERDPVFVVDVVYAAIRPTAEARGLTDEQFGEAMAGDAISDATGAFVEEFANYLPSQKGRLLRAAYAKMTTMIERGCAEVLAKIDAFDVDVEIAKILKPSGSSSGSAPGSSV